MALMLPSPFPGRRAWACDWLGRNGSAPCSFWLPPLRPGAGERLATVTTRLWFASLSDAEIRAYVATGEPLHCAGGFALEGRGGALVERLEGCFSNVIGLSLPLLRRWLAEAASPQALS